jgi:hypothetical protein
MIATLHAELLTCLRRARAGTILAGLGERTRTAIDVVATTVLGCATGDPQLTAQRCRAAAEPWYTQPAARFAVFAASAAERVAAAVRYFAALSCVVVAGSRIARHVAAAIDATPAAKLAFTAFATFENSAATVGNSTALGRHVFAAGAHAAVGWCDASVVVRWLVAGEVVLIREGTAERQSAGKDRQAARNLGAEATEPRSLHLRSLH